MNNDQNESREQSLKTSFNDFWRDVFKNNQQLREYDFYNQLTVSQFIKLKNVLSNINNIITMKLTELFVDELDLISKDKKPEAKRKVQEISANENGYDLVYTLDDNNSIIAEVKCNIPNKKRRFDGGQITNLIENLSGLLKPKDLSVSKDDLSKAYKFMVLLDVDGARDAWNNMINNLKKQYDKDPKFNGNSDLVKNKKELYNALKGANICEIVQSADPKYKEFDPRFIYVIFIKPDDNTISELLDEKNNGCNISAQL